MANFINDVVISITKLLQAAVRENFSNVLIFANNIKQYTLTVGSGTSGIIWTTKTGKIVNVVYVVSGNNTALSVARSGSGTIGTPYLITVTVATNGSGVATSTATQVKAAADLVANVTDILTVTLTGSGAGVVSALASTPLALDTALSKAGVYRTYTTLSGMLDVYTTTDPEYKMASALLANTRKPARFKVYSKETADVITTELAALVQTNNDWYYLVYDSVTVADLHECGDFCASNKKRFIGGTDDLDVLTDRNNANEMYILDDTNEYSNVNILGLMSTYTPGTATWKWKTGNNLSPVGYTQSQLQTIRDNQGQCFTQQSGLVFLNESKTTANTFIEDEVFADYLKARIEEDLLTLLVRQPKVAFDPDGIELIESTVRSTIKGIALVGGIAKVDTTSEDELLLSDDGIYKFTVTTPNASDVSSGDKAQGILNNVNATVYLSGAVHEIGMNLIITI